MADKSAIAWCDATWNPVTGCSHVSAGCARCYAETLSLRRGWTKKPWTAPNAAENVQIHADRLDQPLRWRQPRRIFVNSMSDLFHEQVPDSFIDQVFAVMALARRHTFQVLTKRPARMQAYLTDEALSAPGGTLCAGVSERVGKAMYDIDPAAADTEWPLRNVWLGVSVEDQPNADERIPLLLETPAAVRFLSCEPLLGTIDLSERLGFWIKTPCPSHFARFELECPACNGKNAERRNLIQWVIAGGESGPGFRPMDVEWARSLRDQCAAAGVPFFMKQDSGSRPGKQGRIPDDLWVQEFPQPEAVPA